MPGRVNAEAMARVAPPCQQAGLSLLVLSTIVVIASSASAQQSPASPDSATVRLSFSDNEELKTVIDYVSRRLNVKFVYDEKLAGKRVTIRCPVDIPVTSLVDLLRSLLAYKGLALRQDRDGWYEIIEVDEGVRTADVLGPDRELEGDRGTVVTRVFMIPAALLPKVQALMKTYLTGMGNKSAFCDMGPDSAMLIVTDYTSSLKKLETLVDQLQSTQAEIVFANYRPQAVLPSEAASRLQALLDRKRKAEGLEQTPQRLQLVPQDDVGVLILLGTAEEIAAAKSLLAMVDCIEEVATFEVRLRYVAAERAAQMVTAHLAGQTASGQVRLTVLEQRNSLLITAAAEARHRIESLLERIDVAPQDDGKTTAMIEDVRGVRFYEIRNANPAELARTLSELLGGGSIVTLEAAERERAAGPPPTPAPAEDAINRQQPVPDRPRETTAAHSAKVSGATGPTFQTAEGPRLTVDLNTGTLIVNATRLEHQRLAEMIDRLDQRRPQVLIEAMFIEVNDTSTLDLGVELQDISLTPGTSHLLFTSFGLSTVDAATGARVVGAGPGFNAAIIRPDEVPFVLQALATKTDATLHSAPRILVRDNAEATIESVQEEPFASVNAGATISTTSFAGFAQAGTQFRVRPQISEGRHLNLEFELTINSFTGAGTETTPPPRSTQALSSEVTIPDGYAILVGGLARTNDSVTVNKVPLLGDIPGLGLLLQSRGETRTRTRLFAFIRPVILRDDNFLDLKRISSEDLRQARLSDRFPQSEPLWMAATEDPFSHREEAPPQ
ncbi:MAG: hypothetical protein GXY74_02850 [Phycisphaerae bacterium]|nr:hypothetical protein [Phycisphaerae bacterium]